MVTTVPLLTKQPQPKRPAPGPIYLPPKPRALALPLERLSPYEKVTDQFQDYGLLLQNAVAIHPSNPSFIYQPDQLYLLPLGNQCQLRLLFQRRFTRITLILQGYRDLRVEALDQAGHSLKAAVQPLQRQAHPHQAPAHQVRLQNPRARQLIISSGSAFLVSCIRLFPDQEGPA